MTLNFVQNELFSQLPGAAASEWKPNEKANKVGSFW